LAKPKFNLSKNKAFKKQKQSKPKHNKKSNNDAGNFLKGERIIVSKLKNFKNAPFDSIINYFSYNDGKNKMTKTQLKRVNRLFGDKRKKQGLIDLFNNPDFQKQASVDNPTFKNFVKENSQEKFKSKQDRIQNLLSFQNQSEYYQENKENLKKAKREKAKIQQKLNRIKAGLQGSINRSTIDNYISELEKIKKDIKEKTGKNVPKWIDNQISNLIISANSDDWKNNSKRVKIETNIKSKISWLIRNSGKK